MVRWALPNIGSNLALGRSRPGRSRPGCQVYLLTGSRPLKASGAPIWILVPIVSNTKTIDRISLEVLNISSAFNIGRMSVRLM